MVENNTKFKCKSTSKGVYINYIFLESHSSVINKNWLLEMIRQTVSGKQLVMGTPSSSDLLQHFTEAWAFYS